VDTHLRDISGFEVARKIRDRLPYKRMILTTTYSLDNISSMIDLIGIKSQDVLFKPFSYSDFFYFKRTRNVIQLILLFNIIICYSSNSNEFVIILSTIQM
jgi:ActR/RegA family two-component response regulator